MPLNRAEALQVVDPVLTNLARRYESRGFVAEQLLPAIPVRTISGQYPIFDKQYWFGTEVDLKSSDRAPAVELDFSFDTKSYRVERFAAKVSITEIERQQAHTALRLDQSKLDFLMLRHAIAREKRVADLLRESTNGELGSSRSSTPAINWDQSTATIEADIKTAVLDVYDEIGTAPNAIVIPFKVAYAMAIQEDIREILKYTVNGQDIIRLGDRILPGTIHGMRVIIPQGAVHTTSKEGAASPTFSEIWGDNVRVLYIDTSASWGTPAVAYRIIHTPMTVKRYRTNDPDIEYVLAEEWVQEKVVAPDAGHIIKSLLS